MDSLPIDSDTYWTERLKWSQDAGIGNWKVDWGIGIPGKPLWKFRLTPKARAVAPDVWIEIGGSGAVGDLYRTYDVSVSVSIPETIRRIAAFLAKEDPKDHRIINCEDEVYIGAVTGCSYGIMRHPLNGNMPNGKPDGVFRADFRDIKHRMDEVTRAVRWHRIAQPFPKGDAFIVDEALLTDHKSKPAPARIARGGLALPTVTMPDGKEPPYILSSRHPDGEIAIASIARNLNENGKGKLSFPLADVTLAAGKLDRPVGIFGEYASLTLATSSALAGKSILAQDLAGTTSVDITKEVKVSDGRLTIPGSVIHRVGLMAAKPGDVSDPGLVLVIPELLRPVTMKPMKPGKFQGEAGGTVSVTDKAAATITKVLPTGTPAKLRLSAGKPILPDDGTELRVAVAIVDAAGKPIGNTIKGKLSIIAGEGMFPTGTTFDFSTQNGQDSVEFRSYDRGKVTLKAVADNLEPATIEITVAPARKK